MRSGDRIRQKLPGVYSGGICRDLPGRGNDG